jgi:hypothetical protein
MDAITFTRAGNGTFVGPDGKLAGSGGDRGALGRNLYSFPQDFDNSAWTKTAALATGKAALAPDGTLTAVELSGTGTNTQQTIRHATAAPANTTYTFTIHVKANTYNLVQLFSNASSVGGNSSINFDILNGTIGSTGGTFISWGIQDVGDGWYRLSVTFNTLQNGGQITLALSESLTANYFPPSTGGSVFLWGAQLETGTEATQYFPTNIGQPRFDWGNTTPVPQRNLLTFSEQFDNAAWTKIGVTIASNEAIDPNGGQTADLLSYGTSNGAVVTLSTALSVGIVGDVTFSFWARKKTAGTATLRVGGVNNGTANNALFDAVTITESFQRFSLSAAGTGTGITNVRLANAADGTTGDIYVWGAQLEAGATATEYQPIAQPTTTTPLAANPTSNGILIEEARTNRLLWCRDATNDAWTQTNITVAQDQPGIDGVGGAASRLTATAPGATLLQGVTLVSGNRTCSAYLKRLTGTGAVQVTLDGETWSTVDLSPDEWRRVSLAGTVTNPALGVRLTAAGDEVAMDYGQVEDGLFVTSPILTTTAAATRASDQPRVTPTVFPRPTSPERFTLFGEGTPPGATAGGTLFGYGSGVRIHIGTFSGGARTILFDGIGGAANMDASALTTPTSYRLAGSVGRYEAVTAINGTVGPITRHDEAVSVVPLSFTVGYRPDNLLWWNGCVTRAIYWPAALSPNALSTLTAAQ